MEKINMLLSVILKGVITISVIVITVYYCCEMGKGKYSTLYSSDDSEHKKFIITNTKTGEIYQFYDFFTDRQPFVTKLNLTEKDVKNRIDTYK